MHTSHRTILFLAVASLLPPAITDCCYATKAETLYPANFMYTVSASSTKLITTHKLSVRFGSEFIVTLNEASSAQCKQDALAWDCSVPSYGSSVIFRITSTNPTITTPNSVVTVDGETCTKQESCVAPPPPADPVVQTQSGDEGNINIGAWSIRPAVFWSVLGGLVIALGGMAFAAYRRNKGARAGDPEEQMAESRNTAGWFGEGTDPALGKGYASYAIKAGQSIPGTDPSTAGSSSKPKGESRKKRDDHDLGSGMSSKRQSQIPKGSIMPAEDDSDNEELVKVARAKRPDSSMRRAKSSRKNRPRNSDSADSDEEAIRKSPLKSKKSTTRKLESSGDESDDSTEKRIERSRSRRRNAERKRTSTRRKSPGASGKSTRTEQQDRERRRVRKELQQKPLVEL